MLKLKRGSILLVLLLIIIESKTENVPIKDDFEKAEIVPDIIVNGPSSLLTLDYPAGQLSPGQILTPEETSKVPGNIKWAAETGKIYTLIMLDPDAISRTKPMFRSALHWLVVNIPGDKISEGEVKAAYAGPGPPKGTGLHRYVFLGWEQTQNIQISEFTNIATRAKFSMMDFVKKYKLAETPVAGNYFQAQATT